MNIKQAILEFRAVGIGPWHQVGWRDGRSVWGSFYNGKPITINIQNDTGSDKPGVLIHYEGGDPEYCFAESHNAITVWLDLFTSTGDEDEE